MKNTLLSIIAAAAILGAGCTDVTDCAPGSTQMCTCAGGAMGSQTCNTAGDAWAECSCLLPGEDGGSSGNDAGTGGDTDAGGGGGSDGGESGTDAGAGGTDAGADPGPTAQCAMPLGSATATLQEGGGASSAALVYYSGGALQSIDGMACMPDNDRTGETGDCFDPYICGSCRVLIYYNSSSMFMIGECPAYMGFYTISGG